MPSKHTQKSPPPPPKSDPDSNEESGTEYEAASPQPERQQPRSRQKTQTQTQTRTEKRPPFQAQLSGLDVFDTSGKSMSQREPQNQLQRVNNQQPDKKNTLKLRLDLNLDVQIELKAKIHGDLTLSLLDME